MVVTWKHRYRKGVIKEEIVIVQFVGTILAGIVLGLIFFRIEIFFAVVFVGGIYSLIAFLFTRRSKSDRADD